MSEEKSEELSFDLEVVQKPVKIRTPEGVVKNYVLKELNGTERDKFLNNMSARMRTDPSGKPTGLKTFDGLQSYLISRSLFDEEGKLVSEKEINSWPARVQAALFTEAQKLSGLDQGAEETVKNE